MIPIQIIRDQPEKVKEGFRKKCFQEIDAVDELLNLDQQRRDIMAKLQADQGTMNSLSKEIGDLFKQGKQEEANAAKTRTSELKEAIKEQQSELNTIEDKIYQLHIGFPNLPNPSVPAGNSEEDNEVVREVGTIPSLHDRAVPHWELLERYKLVSLEIGTKITGAGFPLFMGKGARLQRALVSFFLDEGVAAGYTEYIPPFVVNEDSAFGTGSLPDKEGQMYHITADDLYLIPTAEVPVTNIYRDVILEAEDLPIKMVAHSPCFRREAGSYGKHVRGLNRVHQFEKVEIVQLAHPDKSYESLEEMMNHVGGLLEKLGLPYRILRLCGGDLSFASAITYDFEVYSVAQERWLEVSSVSNFEYFQSNRMKARYRDENRKTQLVHTLNGSALALPRILAALLENNQSPEGIVIPEVLHKYTGFDMIV